MAEDRDSKNPNVQNQPMGTQGSVHVDGNVVDSNIIIGSNNTIIIDGKQVAFHTGWFYGHRYGDIENFTGRAAELKTLNDWLNNDKDNLLMLRALGGFGKSILAWKWFNSIDREKWPTAVWWSFYEKESGFESFLAETLNHLGVEVKASARLQVNDLLEAMRGTNILIVLDGFERLLRQYGRMDAALQSDDEDADIDPSQRDCSSPLTETFLRGLSGAGLKSKVLMTTRLCPRALESADGKLLKGCRDESLSAFSPEDAVTYFHNVGIKATRAEIIEVCSAYGYHPLSLSLLVGLINEDHERRGDIAAVKNLKIFEDVKARRHHVLERAYESLAPERRDLLSKISCFRGSMEYAVLKEVFTSPDLDKALLDLRKRGLLQYAGETGRYDMHPIVRHYAYDHFTDDRRRKEAHVGLAKYFNDNIPATNNNVRTLEEITPIIELYYHLVKAGNLNDAWRLYESRLSPPLFYRLALFQIIIDLMQLLFIDGEDKMPILVDGTDQARAQNELANAYQMSGQPNRSISLSLRNLEYDKKLERKSHVSRGLINISFPQISMGSLRDADLNLQNGIDLLKKIGDFHFEAIAHQEMGRLLAYRGLWNESEKELQIAIKLFGALHNHDAIGIVNCYQALRLMLMRRKEQGKEVSSVAIKESLVIANSWIKTNFPYARLLVDAYWLHGASYRMNNELTLAEENLSKALNLCRQINMVDHEADILLDVARLRYAQGDFKDAQEKASEALVITERSGYVLQGADVNLFLARYALEQEKDKAKAKEYAESALKLAYCDGPPYYYKVAYEEAERMLEKL